MFLVFPCAVLCFSARGLCVTPASAAAPVLSFLLLSFAVEVCGGVVGSLFFSSFSFEFAVFVCSFSSSSSSYILLLAASFSFNAFFLRRSDEEDDEEMEEQGLARTNCICLIRSNISRRPAVTAVLVLASFNQSSWIGQMSRA
jgi:hypothetical protein